MYFLSCLHRTKIQTFYVIFAKSCYFYSVHLKEMQNLCEIKINILIKQKLRNVSILTIFFFIVTDMYKNFGVFKFFFPKLFEELEN